MPFKNIIHLMDDIFSLKSTMYDEHSFYEFKFKQSKRLLDNFLVVALTGITAAMLLRIFILGG